MVLELPNLKQYQKNQALSLINDELRSGILLEVTKSKNEKIHVELENICCPKCTIIGTIVLGLKQNENCPKCQQGKIKNSH